jgi:hypothetical protein
VSKHIKTEPAMSQTRWTTFGPDPPLSSLGVTAQQCLTPGASSAACDKYIGSADSKNGFCALDNYKTTTYCACVNNASPCPQFSMASCANAAYAYKPHWWYEPPTPGAPTPDTKCSTAPICVNLVEVGGGQNVVSGITQQCGTIKNISNVLKTNPTLAVLTFLLFITLIVVMSLHADSGGKRSTPPPPPPGLFGGPAAADFPF